MTPDFRLAVAGGGDATNAVRQRLVSLTVTDEAGLQSDRLEIVLEDTGAGVALPRKGVRLDVSLGFLEEGLVAMGAYVVDEVALSGPPDTMTIRAKAADMRASPLKAPRTRAFDGLTLGSLARRIAGEHGLDAHVAPELDALPLGHVDQAGESDLQLMTRLAGGAGATVKLANGAVLLVPRGAGRTASGRALPAIVLGRSDVTRWTVTLADRGRYAAVSARWRDLDGAAERTVVAGEASAGPVYALPEPFPDEATARAAAEARHGSYQRGRATAELELARFRPVMAEGLLELAGFRDGVDGQWFLTRAAHRLTREGLVTSVAGEAPTAGEAVRLATLDGGEIE